jgi:hypothetical protein
LPLFERARIEVYLPEVDHPAYIDLLAALKREFTHTHGGCTVIRGLEGEYLSRIGNMISDRINLVYTDTSFSFTDNFAKLSNYADALRDAGHRALNEEVILVAVIPLYHAQ